MPFTYHLSQDKATSLQGGSIKVFDTRNFPVATSIVGALITVEPGAMRELHVCILSLSVISIPFLTSGYQWHPTQAEWSYFLFVNLKNRLARY